MGTVLKDMYWDTSRRFREDEIIQKIHKDGVVPGVVRILSSGLVTEGEQPVTTISSPKREKRRLVMTSHGLGLDECGTVLEFLKVMFDVVEGKSLAKI
jgi:hypothetical protein